MRSFFHGISAAAGKVGALAAAVLFSNVSRQLMPSVPAAAETTMEKSGAPLLRLGRRDSKSIQLDCAAPFLQISPRAAFYASAGAGLAGLLVTLGFLPDTTGLDLHEIDRMNRYLLADQARLGSRCLDAGRANGLQAWVGTDNLRSARCANYCIAGTLPRRQHVPDLLPVCLFALHCSTPTIEARPSTRATSPSTSAGGGEAAHTSQCLLAD